MGTPGSVGGRTMEPIPVNHPLRRLFAGLTEHAFMAELGVTDTRLIDYITELLARFVHSDGVFPMRDARQRPIRTLAAMAAAAETSDLRGEPRPQALPPPGDGALSPAAACGGAGGGRARPPARRAPARGVPAPRRRRPLLGRRLSGEPRQGAADR